METQRDITENNNPRLTCSCALANFKHSTERLRFVYMYTLTHPDIDVRYPMTQIETFPFFSVSKRCSSLSL